MRYIILAALIAAAVATHKGAPYVLQGQGRITGVRTWDNGNIIYGIQFRYGDIWSAQVGSATGTVQQFDLFEGEAITQVSGKRARFIHWLVFVTNKGRLFMAGQPTGQSFNLYAQYNAELRSISGTSHRALTAFTAHFGVVSKGYDHLGHWNSVQHRTE